MSEKPSIIRNQPKEKPLIDIEGSDFRYMVYREKTIKEETTKLRTYSRKESPKASFLFGEVTP